MHLHGAAAPGSASDPTVRLVCFRLHGQELAIPIGAVRETIGLRPIARVFLTPSWLVGIFSLRGEIVPVIDIAAWLGLSPTVASEESRLVVLRQKGKALALIVDDLAELRTLAESAIAGPPPTLSSEQQSLLAGVAVTPTGTVRVLDAEAIFASDRLRSLGDPAAEPRANGA